MTIKHDENTWALTSKPWGFYPQDGDSSLLQMGTEPDKMCFFVKCSRINGVFWFRNSTIEDIMEMYGVNWCYKWDIQPIQHCWRMWR